MSIHDRLAEYYRRDLELQQQVATLRLELEGIQADCPHENTEVRDAGLFGRSYFKFCSLCRKELGRPETTKDLLEQALLEAAHERAFEARDLDLRMQLKP